MEIKYERNIDESGDAETSFEINIEWIDYAVIAALFVAFYADEIFNFAKGL